MIFHGFQKMTLLDYPGRVACTLFTAGCNFRCPFCHNASLVTSVSGDDTYTEEEVLAFLRKRRGLLDGVCFTGGEPLMQPDIAPFMEQVKALGYAIKLDTNGTSPDKLAALIDAGLVDYVAMDVKNSHEKYAATAGCDAGLLPAVERSIDLLLEGKVDYEFRTTVVDQLHTPDDIGAIARRIAGAPRYFLQAFVDSGDILGADTYGAPDAQTLHRMRERAAVFVPNTELRGTE